MKNGLSKLAKDRVLITAMCACILLITAAALINMYNKNKQPETPDGILSENQTQENPSQDDLQQAELSTEEESRNLIVRIETLPETNPEPDTEPVEETPVDVQPVTEPAAETPAEPVTEPAAQMPEEQQPAAAPAVELNFTADSRLLWPVSGEIIREFSMDTTVWFSTLKQYKCSDAVQIQSAAGTQVLAAANAQVLAVGTNEELGAFILMDLGNGYRAEYAQLADITVVPGDYVAAGTPVATVSAPTYYYAVDGDHLYFRLTHDEELLDPLDYLE